MDHKTDSCPTLLEEDHGDVNAVGEYQGYQNRAGPNRPYGQGPSGNTWRNDAPRDMGQNHHQQAAPQAAPEDIMKELTITMQQNQARTDGAIAELTKQVTHLNVMFSESKKEPGRLPSQTEQNPRGNVSAVTLRSGKKLVDELEGPTEGECSRGKRRRPNPGLIRYYRTDLVPRPDLRTHTQAPGSVPSAALGRDSVPRPSAGPVPLTPDPAPGQLPAVNPTSVPSDGLRASLAPSTSGLVRKPSNEPGCVPLPFPVPNRAPKRYIMDKDVWDLFSRVEINIPLLEAIK
ncbi:unnamed protein product [Rhodiola kirilowii]